MKIIEIECIDAQISKDDVLYPLAEEYGLQISRASTGTIYVSKKLNNKGSFKLRIGHYLAGKQLKNHIKFDANVITHHEPTYQDVEKGIKKYIDKF